MYQQELPIKAEVPVLRDLLAADWDKKAALVAENAALMPEVQAILADEAVRLCWNGRFDDAELYAAIVALIDDIEMRGLSAVLETLSHAQQ